MSFGSYLKRSRELRELSLQEVATVTKLPVRVVAALEADDLGTMQDRAHALLVARSCARAIGLDPEETALRLEEQLQEKDSSVAVRSPWWRRAWSSRPREPLVWLVVLGTLIACAALLLHGR